MATKIQYNFNAIPWKYSGPGGWIFVSLPENISNEIRENLKFQEEGWGRMRTVARIEDLEWSTSIWFDKKRKTYLLPIKVSIRKQLNFNINKVLCVSIKL